VQLARDLFPAETESLEREYLELLARAKSNRPEVGSARELYERNVRPNQITFESIAAHYAISALFEPYPEKARLYCYDVERQDALSRHAGKARLSSGTARVTSRITRASASLTYAVLHLGDHTVTASTAADLSRAGSSAGRSRSRSRRGTSRKRFASSTASTVRKPTT
jgi:hypothetical protein